MSTKLPLAPEADSIDAAEFAFREAIADMLPTLFAEPVEVVEPLPVFDELPVGTLAEFELVFALVGWKVFCPKAKPMFEA
jgi:hypothetical protein